MVWGYATQTYRNFELVIADDGSTSATAVLIARLRKKTKLDVQHVWHEDLGYRKCTIQNRAIAEATGDYLVFTDGDCIPRADFLETHCRLARPKVFLSGGCVRLPRDLSKAITINDVVNGNATSARWLSQRGLRSPKDRLKVGSGRLLAPLLDCLTSTRATFNGCNTSTWKSEILSVNGFDERMQYGGLDRGVGERLMNVGVRHKQVRHRAVCVHLWHRRPYMTESSWRRNDQIRRETRRGRVCWTPYGIDQKRREPAVRRAA